MEWTSCKDENRNRIGMEHMNRNKNRMEHRNRNGIEWHNDRTVNGIFVVWNSQKLDSEVWGHTTSERPYNADGTRLWSQFG